MRKRPFTLAGWRARATSKKQPPYPELTKLLQGLDGTAPAPTILFFGDSVALRVSRDDSDIDTLDLMLAKKLGAEARLLSITHTAYHAEVYRSLVKVLCVTPVRPKLVLLPVNLRSFSPQWDLYPAWQFRSEIEAVENYLTNPAADIASVHEVDVTPEQLRRFDSTPVRYALTEKTRVAEFRSTIASRPRDEQQKAARRRDIFVYHYTHPLDPDHRKLVALEDCVSMLSGLRIPVVTYATPINWQAGVEYVGEEFVAIVKSNLDTVAGRLSRYREDPTTRFADFSMLLGRGCFFSARDATEHLNQHGRHRLTDELAEACRGLDWAGPRG